MALYSRVKTWVSNEILTASDLNAEFDNIINNSDIDSIGGYSANVTEMQTVADPGGVGTESLASTTAEELTRIRYMLKWITGAAQWYVHTGRNLGTGALSVKTADIDALQVTTAKIADLNVTNGKLAGSITYDKFSVLPKLKKQTFTASGTFTAPAGVTEVILIGWGGGGGGGDSVIASGGGGGQGAMCGVRHYTVTPASNYTVTIGAAGGNGGGTGGTGGTTSFDSLNFYGGLGGGYNGAANATTRFGPMGGAVGQAGQYSVHYAGGAGSDGGGGGAGPGGAGAAGGAANTIGSSAAANSGAGGGGAGGSGTQAGGTGGSGQLTVMWVENQ